MNNCINYTPNGGERNSLTLSPHGEALIQAVADANPYTVVVMMGGSAVITESWREQVPRTPDGSTWNRQGFFDHRHISFIGRPFSLEEADEHFSRLNKWGLTFLRFLVTWEAIEHAGPGLYDEAYLDYLYTVVQKAAEYDIHLFIDPHQDVWSRFSGGDGAPGWTFEAVGMDITKFKATGAAFTHQEHGDPYPRMVWPSNYSKFACTTMFTLFFAGNDLAPRLMVDGIPIQEFLQSHYCNAIKQVALRLKDLPNVIGYDTLNEPSQGYIGYPDANQIPTCMTAQGPSPTIYQGMLLAAGIPQQVASHQLLSIRLGKARTVWLNQDGGRALQAVVRPYALKTPGEPLRMSYDIKSHTFEFEFLLNPKVVMPAELFVPEYAYPGGYKVKVQNGRYEAKPETQRVFYYPDRGHIVHKIVITP